MDTRGGEYQAAVDVGWGRDEGFHRLSRHTPYAVYQKIGDQIDEGPDKV